MVQYTLKEEVASFEGNALRNFGKLFRSGIIEKVLKYHRRSTKKPLEIAIPHGNPTDTYVLLTSIAAQAWRKKLEENNKIPKGFTKSPKLGANNYAFSKGVDPTEASTYFSLDEDGVTVFPQGASAIAEFAQANKDQLQLPGLDDIL